MKTNEPPGGAPGDGSQEARIAEKIAWLETCSTALDPDGLAVLHEVFAPIMLAGYSRVWRRALQKGVPEAQADDIVQAVFHALFERIRHVGVDGSIQKMLGSITKGKIFNYLRDEKLEPETVALPSSGSALPESAPDLERALDLRELARRFLPQLSLEHQAVVEKAILEDLTDTETAAALDLREGTVKSRLRAAVRLLRAFGAAWFPSSQQDAA